MGKPIEVSGSTVVDEVLVLDTDRSITGQDGSGFDSAEAAREANTFPGRLAALLFAGVADLTHVFVSSNQVVAARRGGWDDASVGAASDIVASFFVFYPDA